MALHGKTKIELFKNGKPVLVHEEGNMVTNLMSDLLSAHCGPQYLAGNCAMSPSVLYGGVFLFRNPIEEDGDNYGLPADDNALTGRGYDAATLSADLDTGIYNTNLSYQNNAHVHQVWDFDEEHGNGPISCVCLTHRTLAKVFRRTSDYVSALGAYSIPFGAYDAGCEPVFEALSATTLPVFYDTENQVLYCISQLSDSGNLSITKYYMDKLRPITGSRGLNSYTPAANGHHTLNIFKDFYATTVATVNVSQIITSGGTYSGATVDRDGYLYVFACSSATVPTNGQLPMAKIDLRTGSVSTYTFTNYSNATVQLYHSPLSGARYRSVIHRSMNICCGYFCMRTTDGKLLAVNVEDNSEYYNTNWTLAEPYGTTAYYNFPDVEINYSSYGDHAAIRANISTMFPIGPKSIGILYRNSAANAISLNILSSENFSQQCIIPTAYILGSRGNASNFAGNIVVTDKGPYLVHLVLKMMVVHLLTSTAPIWEATSGYRRQLGCRLSTIWTRRLLRLLT